MMKKIKIVFMSAVIVIASCKPVSAAKNDNIKQLVKQLDEYESSYIMANKITENKKIKLTDKEKARAAALSISLDKLKPCKKGEFGGYVTFKLKNELLKKASVNIFGKKISASKLPKKHSKNWIISDAYRNKNNSFVYYTDAETEMDYAVKKNSIKKQNADNYKVEKKFYFGYWGTNNGQPNYKITYNIKANKKSDYGYVVKKIVLKKVK